MDSFINLLKSYFANTTSYVFKYKNGFKIGDSMTHVYLSLSFDSIYNAFAEYESNIDKLKQFVKDDWTVMEFFYSIGIKQLYSVDNSDLILYGKEHSSFKDRCIQGFFKDYYSEFLIEINNDCMEKSGISYSGLMTNFMIENTEVKISYPSKTFKLIFAQINPFITEEGWKHMITISFKKIKKNDVNNYLQEALYLLEKYNPNCFVFGSGYYGNSSQCAHNLAVNSANRFHSAKYFDPLCLFNEAINATKETCFYYFYRVIEFFFPINQKIEMLREIKDFNNLNIDSDELFTHIVDLCSQNEEKNLKYLLNNRDICDQLIWLASSSPCKKSDEILNSFGSSLYKYRNRVIHSKEISRRVPNILEDDNDIDSWNEIVKEISIICIDYFCFENKLPLVLVSCNN